MKLVAMLYGRVVAACTIAWSTKNAIDSAQAAAPVVT
jgi:hypothetical protein